jgi:hypothetical protein
MGALKKLFKPKMPTIVMPDPTPIPVPEVTPAPVMPDSDAVEIKRAQKLQTTRRMQRAGRASTILSSGSSGGDDFGSSRLG